MPTEILNDESTSPKAGYSHLFNRFRLNALSYSYAQLVTLLAQLALIPFFLEHWGIDQYADWLVLTSIPTMLTILDLGVSQASASRATMLAGKQDTQGIRRSWQTGTAFTLSVSIALFLLSCIAAQELKWTEILELKHLKDEQAAAIFVLISAYFVIHMLGGPLDGWFRVIDRTATGAFLLANRRVIDILVSIGTLIAGGDALQLATHMLIAQALAFSSIVIIAKRISPWPILGLSEASWSELRTIWRPAISYTGFPIAQTITLQGGLQILNQISSPSVVVGFMMARTFMRLTIQLGTVANNALKPEISRLAGRGTNKQAKQFTYRATAYLLIICSTAYLLQILIGPQLINWWSHNQVQVSRPNLALIGIHTLLNVSWFIPAAYLMAINKHNSTAIVYCASSALALAVWILAIDWLSPLTGASLLLALPETIVLIFIILKPKGTTTSHNKNNSQTTQAAGTP